MTDERSRVSKNVAKVEILQPEVVNFYLNEFGCPWD